MKLTIKTQRLDWNESIAFAPVSLFVELGIWSGSVDTTSETIEHMYYSITQQTDDVVFYGNIKDNSEALSWLTPKLLSNRVFVTIAIPINEHPIEAPIASRIIYRLNKDNYKEMKYTAFRETDIILIEADSIKILQSLRSVAYSSETQSGLVGFNANLISQEEVLKADIKDLNPVTAL